MKKLFGLLAFLCVAATIQVHAQEAGTDLMIGYRTPENTEIPQRALDMLKQKSLQLATINGMGSTDACARFAIMPVIAVESNEVTPTAPPKQMVKLSITFFLVDNLETKAIYSQATISPKGVGRTTEEAYVEAIKAVNVRFAGLKTFMTQGKQKILAYYDKACNQSVEKAYAAAQAGNCELAYGILQNVPQVCDDCFQKAAIASNELGAMCEQNTALAMATSHDWCKKEAAAAQQPAGTAAADTKHELEGTWELIRWNNYSNLDVKDKITLEFNGQGQGMCREYGKNTAMKWKALNNELRMKIGDQAEKSIAYTINEFGELELENFQYYRNYVFKKK